MGGNEANILTQNFNTIAEIMTSISLLMGICFTLGGLFQLKKHAEQRSMAASHSMAGPMMMFICGGILCVLPKFIGSALLAFWGTDTPLVYQGGPAGYSVLIPPILMFVRIIGVGSFIRGVVLLSKAGGQQSQPGTLGKALVHIFAGILLVHILGTIDLLKSILGMG
ncbi:MAG: hypothetical protein A3F13_02325 [Gammaproteobacteria bacterium RIFCSPHIGHO2_12_FULL_40_19]|nr:MAG: hypothetical protein A3F13_02325 [Gammaproteobacteria bacterium RIFCSPHIGHO2_12_FULL_40_19]